jgi:hypothetical protein
MGDVDYRQVRATWSRGRAPERAVRVLKEGIPPGSTYDSEWAGDAVGDYRASVNAFLESLRSRSVYFRLLSDRAFFQLPFRTRVGVMSQNATGRVQGPQLHLGQTCFPRQARLAANYAMSRCWFHPRYLIKHSI